MYLIPVNGAGRGSLHLFVAIYSSLFSMYAGINDDTEQVGIFWNKTMDPYPVDHG